MKTTHLPSKNSCWRCNYVFDCSTSAQDTMSVPHPGSISVCLMCGALGMYTSEMEVRSLTEKELRDLLASKETVKLLNKIEKYRKQIIGNKGR